MKINYYKLLIALAFVYAILGMFFMFQQPVGAGDEALFISDLAFLENNGWVDSVKKGISIPHFILVYPLSLILEPHIALRVFNLLLLVALYCYLAFRNKSSLILFFYLTFYIGTSKVFFIGTNDGLFILSLVIFINEVHRVIIGKSWNQALAYSALIVAIFTRALFIMYLPVIIILFAFLIKMKAFEIKKLITPVLLMILLLALNIPAIAEHGKLSYDKKLPPSNVNVTWAQRQYLAQILVNEGKLENYQHPSFKETQDYVNANGEGSLPNSLMSGLFFNPNLTIKEFFKDASFVLIYGTRQLGLILSIVLGFLLFNALKKKLWDKLNVFPFALMITIAVFSLVIISFIELRWFAPIFIGAILFYTFLEETKKINRVITNSNLIVMVLLMFYGIYRLLPEL